MAPPVSSDGNELAVAVADNSTLSFSSTRESGLGGIAMYRTPLVDGAYPVVENLGPPINTSYGDDLPFIAPDERYLLFCSERPGGLGKRDLSVSFRITG